MVYQPHDSPVGHRTGLQIRSWSLRRPHSNRATTRCSPRFHQYLGLAAALAIAALFPLLRACAGKLEDSDVVFLEAYAGALLHLKNDVSNVVCTARVEHITTFADPTASGNDQGLVSNAKFQIKGTSVLAMYDYVMERSPGKPATLVACVTPDYAFTLNRQLPGGPMIVNYFGPARWKVASSLERYSTAFVFASHRPPYMPIEDILADPCVRLSGISEVLEGAEKLVDVHFELPGSKLPYEAGKIVLSPKLNWAVREYESVWRHREQGWRTVNSGKISYAERENSRVFPQRIHLVEQTWKGVTEWSKHDWKVEFEEVTFDNAKDHDFSLAAFGLPEITLETERRNYFPFDHWLFWTSVTVAMVCTLLLRYRSRTPHTKITEMKPTISKATQLQ